MPSYTVATDDATTIRNKARIGNVFHHLSLTTNGTATAGTLKVQYRRPGSIILVDAKDVDLTAIADFEFISPVAEWVFTPSGVTGSILIHVTDTATETGKDDAGGIDPADKAKLDAITDTGSGVIISVAERGKLTSITDVGSGVIISVAERAKVAVLPDEADQFMEGIALGGLYAKNVQVG